VKKGRHRRYEEARKFKQRSSSIEDIDLDDDSFFGSESDNDDDPWSELAQKYNVDDDDEDDDVAESG
jgi:hypothetical protein